MQGQEGLAAVSRRDRVLASALRITTDPLEYVYMLLHHQADSMLEDAYPDLALDLPLVLAYSVHSH